jgi:mannose-6-phosphate isomerase-like protein (cupin superfamily)
MNQNFSSIWNPHYDFSNSDNLSEINKIENYSLAKDKASYFIGERIHSPWGTNRVVDFRVEDGVETCVKEITVNPGFVLSLQRHRGRTELWEVLEGTLGVIRDSVFFEAGAGESVEIPKASVHCMVNATQFPVRVRETQRGICRENDNVRLADFYGRATYPLTSETEFLSAQIYHKIVERIRGAKV